MRSTLSHNTSLVLLMLCAQLTELFSLYAGIKLIIMDMWTLHASTFVLITVTIATTAHLAPQVVYQKLEHALITDRKVGYLMQHTFFPSQGSSQDLIFISVNIDSMLPEGCDGHPTLPGTLVNFSYHQKFQWSSSPLLNIIPIDQLLILDNVICRSIHDTIENTDHLQISLHIDTLPCNTSEDDLLEALMQLLPWVYTSLHACVQYMYGIIIIVW